MYGFTDEAYTITQFAIAPTNAAQTVNECNMNGETYELNTNTPSWAHERSPNGINKVFDNRKRVSYSPAGKKLDLGPGKTLSECSQSKGNRCVRGQKYPNFSCVCSRGHRRRVARPPPLLPGAPLYRMLQGILLGVPLWLTLSSRRLR